MLTEGVLLFAALPPFFPLAVSRRLGGCRTQTWGRGARLLLRWDRKPMVCEGRPSVRWAAFAGRFPAAVAGGGARDFRAICCPSPVALIISGAFPSSRQSPASKVCPMLPAAGCAILTAPARGAWFAASPCAQCTRLPRRPCSPARACACPYRDHACRQA